MLNYSSFSVSKAIAEEVEALQGSTPYQNVRITRTTNRQIWTDRNKFGQVISNLLISAIKYSHPDTNILVDVLEMKEFIQFSITNRGVGISKDMLPFVFDQYTSIEETSQNHESKEPDLYATKAIIEQYGGEMGVESEPNSGTTFWFILPAKQQAVQESF